MEAGKKRAAGRLTEADEIAPSNAFRLGPMSEAAPRATKVALGQHQDVLLYIATWARRDKYISRPAWRLTKAAPLGPTGQSCGER